MPTEQDADTATEQLPAKTDGHVEFEHVTFSYTPDKPLIEDLSFTAEPGPHRGDRRDRPARARPRWSTW